MDIEDRDNYAEYILPCVVNVLSEDDVILEFDISTDVSMLYYSVILMNLILTLTYYSHTSIFIGFVCIRKKSCKLCKII